MTMCFVYKLLVTDILKFDILLLHIKSKPLLKCFRDKSMVKIISSIGVILKTLNLELLLLYKTDTRKGESFQFIFLRRTF